MRVICIISLLFALSSIQNVSAASKDLPKIPAVIAQSDFEYQGEQFEVQLIPSSDTVVRQELYNGGGVSEGDFVLTSRNPAIVLRSGSKVLSQITPIQGAQFVQNKSDSNWGSPLFLLTRKDKFPLIAFAQYGSSNGSDYRIYLIQQQTDKFEITPVEFSDMCYGDRQNVLFGTKIQMFYDETMKRDYLRIDGYDNSLGAFFRSHYIADFDEVRWRLVEHHSDVAPVEKPREDEG